MKEQRQQDILNYIRSKEFVTIEELSSLLSVSTSTIRRDLGELDRMGLIVRSRNGAVSVSELSTEGSVSFRSGLNPQSKTELAKAAVRLIKRGSLIFLDSSTTVVRMANYMRNFRDITVVTNSLLVAKALDGCDFPVYLIGGELIKRAHAFSGPLAEEALCEYHFDYVFLSPVAISQSGEVSEASEPAATIRKSAMARGKCLVLLCDQSKLNLSRAFVIGHIGQFDYIITDDKEYLSGTSAHILRV